MSFMEPGLFDMIMRLRGRGIFDTNVLRAMEQIPRSGFVSIDDRMQSYEEEALGIGCGQVISPPLTTAILCQTLEVTQAHKVLHIGTGSGYMTALLAKLSTRVYSIERHKPLAEAAENIIQNHVANTVIKHGDGRLGWRGQAPFERIVLSASVRLMPSALLEQLSPDGRMVAVVGGQLSVAQKQGGKIKETALLPLDLPPIEPGKA